MKILLVFLIGAACISGCRREEGRFVSANKEVETIRHCIGRSIVDIPTSLVASPMALGIFKEKSLDHQASSIDVIISTLEISAPSYLTKTEERERVIREMADDIKVLRTVRKIDENITIFGFRRSMMHILVR